MRKDYIIAGIVVVIVLGGFILLMNRKLVIKTVLQSQENVEGATSTSTSAVIPLTETKTPSKTQMQTKAPISSPVPSKNTGRVIFSIADEAVGLDAMQSILLTVSELSIHSPQSGWVSILKTPRALDLLDLHRRTRNELFADVNLGAGTYDQMRLLIGNVVVIPKGGLKSVEVTLPSQTLTFNAKLVVEKGKTSGVSFDFVSAKSLHRTTDGALMFFPVVKVTTEHGIGTVQVLGGNVELFNGLADFGQTFGLDENGNFKADFALGGATRVELLGEVIRLIPSDEKPEEIKIPPQSAIDIAVTSGYISRALSVQTILRENKRVWQIVGIKGAALVAVYVDISTGAVMAVK